MRLEQLADAVLEHHRLSGGLRQLNLTLEDLQQVVPALRRAVQPIQRLNGASIGGVQVGDVVVSLDRVLDVVELAVVDLTHLEQDPLLVVSGLRQLHLPRVDVLQIGPALQVDKQLL